MERSRRFELTKQIFHIDIIFFIDYNIENFKIFHDLDLPDPKKEKLCKEIFKNFYKKIFINVMYFNNELKEFLLIFFKKI